MVPENALYVQTSQAPVPGITTWITSDKKNGLQVFAEFRVDGLFETGSELKAERKVEDLNDVEKARTELIKAFDDTISFIVENGQDAYIAKMGDVGHRPVSEAPLQNNAMPARKAVEPTATAVAAKVAKNKNK